MEGYAELLADLISILLALLVVLVGLLAGQITEVRHFANLRVREEAAVDVILSNLEVVVLDRPVLGAQLVTGHVVISTDYFKSLCASLRTLVGGRVRSYEKLLERARREAVLRLKDEARTLGAKVVLNVRFETISIARSRRGSGLTGVEVLAYGTAVRT